MFQSRMEGRAAANGLKIVPQSVITFVFEIMVLRLPSLCGRIKQNYQRQKKIKGYKSWFQRLVTQTHSHIGSHRFFKFGKKLLFLLPFALALAIWMNRGKVLTFLRILNRELFANQGIERHSFNRLHALQ